MLLPNKYIKDVESYAFDQCTQTFKQMILGQNPCSSCDPQIMSHLKQALMSTLAPKSEMRQSQHS